MYIIYTYVCIHANMYMNSDAAVAHGPHCGMPPDAWHPVLYRGTSPIRKRSPLGPYRRPMPRVMGG